MGTPFRPDVHTKLQLTVESLMSTICGSIDLLGMEPKYSQISTFFNGINDVAFEDKISLFISLVGYPIYFRKN